MGNSSIRLDIDHIHDTAISNKDYVGVSIILHTRDLDIVPESIKEMNIIRDYVTNTTDYISLYISLGLGDIVYDVYPHRGNLEATVKVTNLDGEGNKTTSLNRYKAVLLDLDKDYDSPFFRMNTQEDLNKSGVIVLKVQCYLREYEAIRNIPIVCNLSNTTVEKAMKTVLGRATSNTPIKIDGSDVDIDVDIVPPHNKESYGRLQYLSEGATDTILNFPSYLQHIKGVYNGHIGTYLQDYKKPTIFVYPINNKNRYEEVEDKIDVFLPYDVRLSKFSEKTYIQEGSVLKIAGSEVKGTGDNRKNNLLDKGSGIATFNPTFATTRSTVKEDEGVVNFDPSEVVTVNSRGSVDDGTENIKYGGTSTNNYELRSKIMDNELIFMDFTWRFCNTELIYPGMPISIYSEQIDKTINVYQGIVGKTFTKYDGITKSMMSSVTCLLHLTSSTNNSAY